MKILHTADWHLGKRLDTFSRLEEQREVLQEICEIADREEVDAVIIAGDLFDNFNPSSEATELLYSTLHRLSNNGKRAIIAIAGNHDSPERIEVPDALARACGIIFAGYPNSEIKSFRTQAGVEVSKTDKGFVELKLPEYIFPLRLILTPYANELRLKKDLGAEESEDALRVHLQHHWQELADKYFDSQGVNILVSHLFFMKKGGEQPEEPDDEKPILHVGGASAIYSENIPAQTQYVALGHLHRYQIIDKTPCPIVYSSSPLAYSFAEANQIKFVVLLDAEPNKPIDYQPIGLTKGKKLLRGKFDNIDEAVAWLEEHLDDLVEITIISENYLEVTDKRRLQEVHQGLIQIIPEIKSQGLDAQEGIQIDLTMGMEELFTAYFKQHKIGKGQEPSEGLMAIFREVQGEEES
ncbi:MAG: exonuclease subunit SbcD [Bacteroidota bacterium]